MGEWEKGSMGAREPIRSYRELDVYKLAMEGAVHLFELTKSFRSGEKFSLVDRMGRSSLAL